MLEPETAIAITVWLPLAALVTAGLAGIAIEVTRWIEDRRDRMRRAKRPF